MDYRDKIAEAVRHSNESWLVSTLLWAGIALEFAAPWYYFS